MSNTSQLHMQNLIKALEEVKEDSYSIKSYYDEVSGLDVLDLDHYAVDEVNHIGSHLLFNERSGRLQFDVKDELHRTYGYRTLMIRSVNTEMHKGWTIAGIEVEGVGVVPCHNNALLKDIEIYNKRKGRN